MSRNEMDGVKADIAGIRSDLAEILVRLTVAETAPKFTPTKGHHFPSVAEVNGSATTESVFTPEVVGFATNGPATGRFPTRVERQAAFNAKAKAGTATIGDVAAALDDTEPKVDESAGATIGEMADMIRDIILITTQANEMAPEAEVVTAVATPVRSKNWFGRIFTKAKNGIGRAAAAVKNSAVWAFTKVKNGVVRTGRWIGSVFASIGRWLSTRLDGTFEIKIDIPPALVEQLKEQVRAENEQLLVAA